MQAIKIKKNIYWVGAIDWQIRNFHGYSTPEGTTYNAYLIIDKKITLIDTVKKEFAPEMLARIASVINPEKIDYIISNHVEMDHSGSLPMILEKTPNALIYTSDPAGHKGLLKHFQKEWAFKAVKSNETLNTGEYNFKFIQTPMIHWPDNMVCYLEEEQILFSNDSFGQHLASSERFSAELPLPIILENAKKYYANIVMPYGEQVQRALSLLQNLTIQLIAPSHGLIWNHENIPQLLKAYDTWSKNETEKKALIIYDTMWGSTEKIAYLIQEVFEAKGIKTELLNLRVNHISDIMTKVLTAKYLCVGSSTLNLQFLPTVGGFLTYLRGLFPKNRIGLAFGSYGWRASSIEQIEAELTKIEAKLLPNIKVNYIPDDSTLSSIKANLENALKESQSQNE
ncbi:MAG: FprA family A-type flavoprotein [Candidatus Margulisiibacteriota bacterium]|jgi:flavorubredoxin